MFNELGFCWELWIIFVDIVIFGVGVLLYDKDVSWFGFWLLFVDGF